MANSNTSKVIENIIICLIIIIAIVAFPYGLVKLIDYQDSESKKRCDDNVKLVGAKEWKYTGGSCYLIKDGKIEEIK